MSVLTFADFGGVEEVRRQCTLWSVTLLLSGRGAYSMLGVEVLEGLILGSRSRG